MLEILVISCSAIQKEIVASSAFQRIMALASLKISLMYMELKRIYEVYFLRRSYPYIYNYVLLQERVLTGCYGNIELACLALLRDYFCFLFHFSPLWQALFSM